MKVSKKSVKSKLHAVPEIQFQDQKLTSHAGASILQVLFKRMNLRNRLFKCFEHLGGDSLSYGYGLIALTLVVHLYLGKRKLQDIRYYKNDPMVARLLGVDNIPTCSTVSRRLSELDAQAIIEVRYCNRNIVLERLQKERFSRITLDFDGSVLSTGRKAQGSAVGYNKKKKGQRSYYPLYCTIAQTGQVFDVWNRPGNVHDSNGASAFILDCIDSIKSTLPRVVIELRMDSAFFSDQIVQALSDRNIEFSISVPFARYSELKSLIEERKRWRKIDDDESYFENNWKPKCWTKGCRFVFVRNLVKVQQKGPLQLDMFTPYNGEHEFKVIVTNKRIGAKKLIQYHNGRGYQENIFSELKSQIQMDYVPARHLCANQMYLLAAIIVHNANHEMQMICSKPVRGTTEKRAPRWIFEKIGSIRSNLINIAGRLSKPKGRLTMTMNRNDAVESEYADIIAALAA